MRIHRLQRKPGLASITPESPEDLWTLRRIISLGDILTGETSRAVKETKEYARPDKGERVRVKLSIEVGKVKLDSSIDRLRVSGKILEVSEEFVTRAAHHSFTLTIGNTIAIRKKVFPDFHISLVKKSSSQLDRIIIVALDRREAGIGKVVGTHLMTFPTIDSGIGGKLYSNKKVSDQGYFARIASSIKTIHEKGIKIVCVGPGQVKRAFANFVAEAERGISPDVIVIDGVDVTGGDGVFTSLRSTALREVMKETTLANAQELLATAISRISQNDERVTFSVKESKEASTSGSIESLLVSSRIFETGNEEQVVELLNSVEKFGGKTVLVDDSTDAGKQIESLGGVVGLLRYPRLR
jgi:protein pelota